MAIRMHMPPLTSVRGQTLLTDSKPYLYRQSPVVAQMLEDKIVGGTVAWNQTMRNITDTSTFGANGGSVQYSDGRIVYVPTT